MQKRRHKKGGRAKAPPGTAIADIKSTAAGPADSLLVSRFRELATRFDQWAGEAEAGTLPIFPNDGDGREALYHLAADEDAGRLIVCAFRAGYLQEIPGLAARVKWHEAKDVPADKMQAVIVRCLSNLFGEIVGGQNYALLSTVKRAHGGLDPCDLADEPLGGLLSAKFPMFDEPDRNLKNRLAAKTCEDRDWFFLKGEAVKYRRRARACRLLVDMIEEAVRSKRMRIPADASQEGRGAAAAETPATAAQDTPKPLCRVSPCHRLAHESYEWACKDRPDLAGAALRRFSAKLYSHVKENWEGYAEAKRPCPSRRTWERYVREGDPPKTSARAGRTGRSIIRPDEL